MYAYTTYLELQLHSVKLQILFITHDVEEHSSLIYPTVCISVYILWYV